MLVKPISPNAIGFHTSHDAGQELTRLIRKLGSRTTQQEHDHEILPPVRIVTNDIDKLLAFYATLTGALCRRASGPRLRRNALAPALPWPLPAKDPSSNSMPGAATAAANHSAILEFQVDNVDGVRARLGDTAIEYVMQPVDQPLGQSLDVVARSGWESDQCFCADSA